MVRSYEIGPFHLDPEAGVLMHGGSPTALGARAVAVLGALVEHANEFVPKDRIIDAAWPGVIVEEGNLAVQIAAIRRVLAQAGGERWIETLARRGYRFVGPVTELKDGGRGRADVRQRSNLPQPLTSFVGRERELVEIKRLLPGKRLLTLVGAGGIGKTRLALQAAGEVVDAYRDGAWFVDLALLANPALVPGAVAQVLRVQERTGVPTIESLRAHLRSRQLLLILDNCEHLLAACSLLVDAVLRDAAEAAIMATSREPLRVDGEKIYSLQSLSLADSDAEPEEIGRSEAVQLFVERVQRQLPGFELTRNRARVVAELCSHLDGIPLALELAAARARSLSVEQLNARLGDRFRLLTGGSPTALPRQQTLRATLDWSYDLLAENERLVLRRLSILPGSFSIEAAAAVSFDEAVDEHAVIDVVGQLVSRSLVIADTGGAAARYRLLETTGAYALEQLAEVGETDTVRRRHARYFRDFFQRSPDDWFTMSDAEWYAKYVPELAHVRAALDWAFGAGGDPEIGIALTGLSAAVWPALGLFGEGERRLETGIAQIGPRTPDSDQARLWVWLGRILEDAPAQALPALERAVGLYRRLGDSMGLGMSLIRLGRMLAFMGRLGESEAAMAEARFVTDHAEMQGLHSFYLFNFAFLKACGGDLVTARRYYEDSLALDRKKGNEFGVLATLGNLANITWFLGDLDATVRSFREQVALIRDSPTGSKHLLGWALASLAGVLAVRGELGEALVAAREGLPLLEEDGSAWIFIDHVALRAALAGKLSDAARLAGHSDHIWSAKQATRHPVEARARDRLLALLREELPAGDLERLLAEGAQMSEHEACRVALED